MFINFRTETDVKESFNNVEEFFLCFNKRLSTLAGKPITSSTKNIINEMVFTIIKEAIHLGYLNATLGYFAPYDDDFPDRNVFWFDTIIDPLEGTADIIVPGEEEITFEEFILQNWKQ